MKPFDLELAKAGNPVQTRDGRPARIICYDRKANAPIIALILEEDNVEYPHPFYNNGKRYGDGIRSDDLFMVSTKKEGWMNIYRESNKIWRGGRIFDTEKEALENASPGVIITKKIEWEE